MNIIIQITSISEVKNNTYGKITYYNMTIEGHCDVTGGDYLFSVSGQKFCNRVTNSLKAGMCITAEYSCEVRRSKSGFAWQVLKLTNFTIGTPNAAPAAGSATWTPLMPGATNPFAQNSPQNGSGSEYSEEDNEGIDLNEL